MIFKSKIFRRFLTVYLPLTLVPLIIAAFIALWYGRIEIRDQTFRQLQIMADGAEAQVLDYLNYLKVRTSGYSASKPIIDALKRRYRHTTENNNSVRYLNRYLTSVLKNFPECVEMFVLDVNGRVIASSDASNTGKDLLETDYFLNGRKAVYVSNIFREEETGRITWLISCPVRDVKVNRLPAVLVCRINPVTLSDITTERKVRALGAKSQALRIGKTGETYIVNRDNLMITESRFPGDVILKQTVDTEIVRCTRKIGETKAGNYPDYRGVPVDGASMIIWETGWIIISETDYKESIIPFQRLFNLCLTGMGTLTLLIFFASWLLSRRFIRPVMRLVQADREIIQGDPSRAFISDREIPADELGEVMHIRNIMLASLKENEKELQRQSEELQTIIDSSPILIFYKDKENRFIRVNKALADATGLPKEAIEGKTMFEIYPHYAEKYWEDDKEVIASGHPKINIIEPVELKGVTRWVQTDKIPYRNESGDIIGIIGFAIDITERRQAELMLRESNEKFIALSVSAQDAIIMMDDEGNISFWNEAAERLFGYSRKEAVGNRVSELIIPHRYRLAHREGLKKFKETGKGPVIGKITALEAVRKDGKEFPMELSLSAFMLKERWCAVGIIRDISKRVRREEELRLSYKMASLGQLTAGVFHEILNPINIISTHVQLLLADAGKGSGIEKDLKSIQEEIKRVQDITDGLLRFSRKESVETKEIDVNQLMDSVLTILVSEIKYNNIQLFRKFDNELPLLKANADLLRQVFLNLIKNAIDAMVNGGSLTISTLKCLKDERPCLCIQFTDTGCGIPKEHLDKIFDPFFTTKEEGKGVGMGLTIVYTTIQKFGGSISVSSEIGKGSTFTIELPLPPDDQNKEANNV